MAPADDPPSDVVVLSFMPPHEEAACAARWKAAVVSGRAFAPEVRAEARERYVQFIARLAATPVGGRTLREALRGPDGVSRWWFLKPSEKDCEWDEDLYTTVLRLTCVRRVAERHRPGRIRVHGGPPVFRALEASPKWARVGRWRRVVRALAAGLVSRGRLVASSARLWLALRRAPAPSHRPVDVLLHGEWGWSVRAMPDGRLHDRYFTDLPGQLAARGLTVGWLAVCEVGSPVVSPSESLHRRVAAARAAESVALLEDYVSLRQIVARAFDVRYLVRFLRFNRSHDFRKLCVVEGVDLHPEIERQIVRSLAGAGVARLELLAAAVSRACATLRPRLALTFLELLLQSRAIYAGTRRAGAGVTVWTAQHAAYGRDKLFGIVDPTLELRGEPDGCPVPAPDGIFVMGDLSRDIWLENGFAKHEVVVTGGLRYQHVRIHRRSSHARARRVRILVAGSLNAGADLDMCDAVSAAVSGWHAVEARFRDHPAYRRSASREFRPFRQTFEISRDSLEDDFAWSDVVVFNHSSLGEEAVLKGIPAWQWLWPGVNESVFLDLPVVPRFTSVTKLRQALESLVADPESHAPAPDVQELLWRQCFGGDASGASACIAEQVALLVSSGAGRARS